MKLLTKEIMKRIPKLYAQDGKGDDAVIHVKFFDPSGSWTWFATEASAVFYDGEDTRYEKLTPENVEAADDVIFFGMVHGFEKELGNFSLNELKSVRGRFNLGIERDMHFGTKTLGDIAK